MKGSGQLWKFFSLNSLFIIFLINNRKKNLKPRKKSALLRNHVNFFKVFCLDALVAICFSFNDVQFKPHFTSRRACRGFNTESPLCSAFALTGVQEKVLWGESTTDQTISRFLQFNLLFSR